jgi:hypothetical protein
MLVPPKKNQYALRAIFELAKHMDQGPVKISDIATAQSIPLRFSGSHPQSAQGQRYRRFQARLLRRVLSGQTARSGVRWGCAAFSQPGSFTQRLHRLRVAKPVARLTANAPSHPCGFG